LLRNLRSGFSLLLLRRQSPDHFVRTFDQLTSLFILNLLVWAALDTLHAEVGSELRLDGLYDWSFYLLLGFFACALVGRAYSRTGDTRSLLIPVLSVSAYVFVVFWFLTDLSLVDSHPALELVLAVLYLIVLSVRVIQAAYTTARAGAVLVAIVLVMAAPFVMRALDLDTRLWLTDDVEEQPADDTSGEEALFYDQPARLVAATEHMEPRDPANPNVFYLGFAGDGEQDIFKREELFAQQVLGEHFGSEDRSVDLINDNDDRDSYPLATVSAVQQTLKLMASRMDVEQDMLVLMLTSHGSREGLAVVNGTLPMLQLSPVDLERALDDSGIKWRVIIVSACYSGVFADALKGDDTLVITASDSEHSSFGCDDQRDLTYFGEAFLKDSVPTTKTLEAAFKKAAGLIQERESSEHKTPSHPQMSIGVHMREKLAELEGQPAARPKGNVTTVWTH
jgi:peptidase C13-like protein